MTRPSLRRLHPVQTDDLVRVGSLHDGGYVVNERCIRSARMLVGLGISSNWEFEADFQRRNPEVRVVALDRSVSAGRLYIRGLRYYAKAVAWAAIGRGDVVATKIARARVLHRLSREFRRFFAEPRNTFIRRNIAARASPRAVPWDGGALARALGDAPAHGHAVFVKMDIEGSEYRVLPALLRDASRFSGLAVEFHDCGRRWREIDDLIHALEPQFVITHVHGNNSDPLVPGTDVPETLEITCLHRALLTSAPVPSLETYPLAGLDAPNVAARPDFTLRFD